MNKILRKMTAITITAFMVISLSVSTFAKGNTQLQINNNLKQDILLENKEGNVVISASDTKKLFGETPKEDMVSIREIATEKGYTVGWDQANKTVILIDKEQLLKDIGEFNIMDQYLQYAQKFTKDKYSLNGKMDFEMQVLDMESGTTLPVKATANIEGLTYKNKQSINMIINYDFSKIKANSEEEMEKLEKIKEISTLSFQIIMDMDNFKMYMTSPEMLKLLEMEENTWVMMDVKELLQKLSPDEDMEEILKSAMNFENNIKYKELLKAQLNLYTNPTSINDYKMLVDQLSIFNDKSFNKEGNKLISKYEENIEGLIKMVVAMIINQDENENINGYSVETLMDLMDTNIMNIKTSVDANDKVDMSIKYNIPGLLSLDGKGSLQYKKTDKEPLSSPGSNTKLMNILELIK